MSGDGSLEGLAVNEAWPRANAEVLDELLLPVHYQAD